MGQSICFPPLLREKINTSGKIHEWLKLMAVRYKEKKKEVAVYLWGRVLCGKIHGFRKLMTVRYKEKEEVVIYLYVEVECDKCNMGFEKAALNVRYQSLYVPFNVPSVIFSNPQYWSTYKWKWLTNRMYYGFRLDVVSSWFM